MERKTDTMNHTFDAVAFTEIIEQLAEYANSPQAKEKIRNLQPYLDEGELKRNMRDTTQARQMLDLLGTPPLPVMEQIGHIVEKAVLGELLLPEVAPPFPGWNADNAAQELVGAGFSVLQKEEAYTPIRFFDVAALVWFAKIIEWEFRGFSFKRCLDGLCEAQKRIEQSGELVGTAHRFLLAARKPG